MVPTKDMTPTRRRQLRMPRSSSSCADTLLSASKVANDLSALGEAEAALELDEDALTTLPKTCARWDRNS